MASNYIVYDGFNLNLLKKSLKILNNFLLEK